MEINHKDIPHGYSLYYADIYSRGGHGDSKTGVGMTSGILIIDRSRTEAELNISIDFMRSRDDTMVPYKIKFKKLPEGEAYKEEIKKINKYIKEFKAPKEKKREQLKQEIDTLLNKHD